MGNDSGAAKGNKKRRLEAMALSQKGALDKFIVRDSQVNSENQASDDNIGDDTVEADAPFADAHIVDDAVIGDQSFHPNIDDDPNTGDEGNGTNVVADDINNSSHPDIFDPRTWDELDKKRLIFWCKRVLKETCLLSMVLKTMCPEGFLQYHTIEFSQMEKNVIENGLYIAKSLTKYFVSVANY
jgi:hypothetical protein